MRAFSSYRIGKRHEALEPRLVLSAAPVVTAVEIGSTMWDANFDTYVGDNSLGQVNALQQHGYSIGTGSDQLRSLPWNNLNTISVRFDQDVDIDINDLTVTGVTNSQYGFSGFAYDPQELVATWTLSQTIPEDRLLIDLNADGADPVANLAGDRLDGEWIDSSSTFNSGDSTEGGDFEFTVLVTPADVDRDSWVSYYDYIFTYYGSGLTTADPTYNPLYDVDGSGAVDLTDYSYVYANLGLASPSGDPAGVANEAPTADPHSYLEVQDRVADQSIDLNAIFDDPDDADGLLTYAIVSNSDASLFDSVSVSSVTGELAFNAVDTGSGRATIVVQATDPDGLQEEVTVTVDVGRTNAPPEISSFQTSPTMAGTILIFGYVTDLDDDPVGWIVDIAGAIQTRAAVWSDNWFLFSVIDDPAVYGPITATVADPHGATDTAFEHYGNS